MLDVAEETKRLLTPFDWTTLLETKTEKVRRVDGSERKTDKPNTVCGMPKVWCTPALSDRFFYSISSQFVA